MSSRNMEYSLHVAAGQGDLSAVKALVERGADINAKDDNGMTPLHCAVKRNHLGTVKYLVGKGVDTNVKDGNGRAPLHIAAGGGHDHTVLYLADNGADVNIKDNNGRTPLHVAVSEDYKYTVEYLIKKGADVSIKDTSGMTPLHVAAERGRYRVVEYLIDLQTEISAEDNDGRTPLHIAAKEGFRYTVETLVMKGANIKIKDKNGRTAHDVAVDSGHTRIAQFLTGGGIPDEVDPFSDHERDRSKEETSDIDASQKMLEKLHSLLRTKNTINTKSAFMVVSGPPHTGKSTIIHRLVRDLSAVVPKLNLPSTPILGKPLRVGIKKLTTTKATVKEEWVERTTQDERHRALKHSLALTEVTQKIDSSIRKDTHGQTSDTSPVQVTQQQTTQPTQSTDGAQNLPTDQLLPFPPLEVMPTFETPDQIIVAALKELSILKDSEDLDGSTMLHIVDTGGQPEFQSVLSWLLLKPAITVQVFNLSVGLKERYDVWYESQDGQITEPYKSSFTVEEVIFQAQSSLTFRETTHCPSELNCKALPFQSKSLFVGTHRDHVSDEDFSRIDSTLKEQLQCSPFLDDKVVYYHNPQTFSFNVVFPIDNTKTNDPGIIHFREKVNQLLKTLPSSEFPISWEWFKLSVLSTNVKTMTVDQCVVIGRASGMEDKAEVLLALWYHTHFTGEIQHYNIEGINDTVWLDPQLISDGISTLISSSFSGKGPFYQNQVKYRETGRFPVLEVKKILEGQCHEVSYQKLIILFEHLHVLTPITNEQGEIVEYFVPCVLQPKNVESIKRGTISAFHPAPLLFTFKTGFTPIGVFHALVVYLSSTNLQTALQPWKLSSKKPQFRNKVTFFVGKDFDEVTLVAQPQFLEVWIDREDDVDCSQQLSDVCSEVRSTLDIALTCIKNSEKSTLQVDHNIAFYCNRAECHCSVPHAAFPEGYPPKRAICSFLDSPCKLGEHHCVWLKERSFQTGRTPTKTNVNGRQSGSPPKDCQRKSDEVVHQVSGTTTVERLSEENLELWGEISTLREENLLLQEEIRKFKSTDQPDRTECVGFREKERRINIAAVKQQLSDDFSLEPKTVKLARLSNPRPSVKRYKFSKGGSSWQARETEGDPSAVSESCDLQVAPSPPPHESKRRQKRSLSGSSVSNDSLSPPSVKKKKRPKKQQHSTPSSEQTRGASPLPQQPDDRREQNETEHISDLEMGQTTRRTADSTSEKEDHEKSHVFGSTITNTTGKKRKRAADSRSDSEIESHVESTTTSTTRRKRKRTANYMSNKENSEQESHVESTTTNTTGRKRSAVIPESAVLTEIKLDDVETGSSDSDTLPEQVELKMKIMSLEAEIERLRRQLDQNKPKSKSQPCPLASTPRSQAAVEEDVTHQWQQHAEDSPVQKPQVILNETEPLSSAVKKAKQLGVQFIDPIETISCDTHGCDYYNPRHDVEVNIPEGAIHPSEGRINIEFGVAMYGPFKLADGISIERVSPFVWLCVQQDGFSGFQKDVKITIPHFLDFSTEDAHKYLRFLKADHQFEDGEIEYQLKSVDGRTAFNRAAHGTLLTKHFCSVCIASSVPLPDEKTKYYLGGAMSLKGQEWQIIFYVCYFLSSCIRTMEQQLDKDSKLIHPTRFMFADGKELRIKFHKEVSGWQLAMESSNKISAEEVDFQKISKEELQLLEDKKLYPPRFVITVTGSNDAENSRVVFIFEGTTQEITKEILLNKAIGSPPPPPSFVYPRICLEDVDCTTVLGVDDLQDVRSAVADLVGSWKDLGISLGIQLNKLDAIKSTSPSECLTEMLALWLKQNYDVERFKMPTWNRLVEAVKDGMVGKNPALAQAIANNHLASL